MVTANELIKRAEKAEAEKNFIEAGPLYERAGDIERAIAAYRKGGGVDRAALLLESTGRAKEAAALLLSVGSYEKAAAMYEKTKDYAKAAHALLRANQRERAAGMYERAEAFEDAAKIYVSLGNHRKAIQLYQQAGLQEKANELQAQVPQETARAPGLAALDANMDLAAAEYVDSGRLVDTVVQLLRAARAQDAAKLYGNCQEDIGYNVLAAIAGDRAVEMKAAEMFYLARDYAKAGQLLENLEDYPKAAAMYERADDAYMAAEMYTRAGDMGKAAEMFEKHGNYQQAAEFFLKVNNYDKAAVNFEKSVNNFVAGKLYFRMNKMNKSLQLLQKVQRNEAAYFEACRLIGEILAQNGYLDLAIRKYLEVVQAAQLSKDTAPVFYNLARTLEQRGAVPQAMKIYQDLLAWQFDYSDVKTRIASLQSGPAPKILPGAPAAGAAPVLEAAPQPVVAGTPEAAPQPALVSMMDGFDFLKSTPLFKDLSLDEMKAVYAACETQKFAPGAVMIEQGQPGESLYVLRKGSAKVTRVGAGGAEEMVARMGPGSPAGEMSLVDDAPTSARVTAESEVDAFVINRPRFEKLLVMNDKIAVKLYRFFVQTLSKRLRATSENFAKAAHAQH
ncbi:MAG: cyclic nucleotide-binding domain-containing protein [Archangiaceae bacterium]|nr:cyclic nucleotide-binding domain-containing protein [Archangiaceae bacterium]